MGCRLYLLIFDAAGNGFRLHLECPMFERGSLVVFDGRVYEVVRIMRNGSYMIRSNIQRWTMNVAGTALSAANAVQSNDYNVAVLMLGRPCSWRDRLYRINGFVDAVTVDPAR